MSSSRLKYFLAAISSTAMWGFFAIPLRNLKEYPSDEILYYRIFTSLLITWAIILLFRRKQLRTDRDHLRNGTAANKRKLFGLILLAGILITGNWFSYIYAVNHVSLKSAAFAYMVCPLITALGGFLILKEHLTSTKLTAIGIACVSIAILSKGSLIDVFWSIFIASLYAFYLIIQRAVRDIDKFNMLGIQLIISSILVAPFFILQFHQFPTSISFWVNILIVSVVFTIIPLFLSLFALVGMPSSTMGIIIYVNPVVAFAVAILYFGEGISSLQITAYLLLLLAVVVFNSAIIKDFVTIKFKRIARLA